MRTIKFRGKRLLLDNWEYGNLIQRPDGEHFIQTEELRICPVKDFTIGQFTGLCDRDGREIYEGDIIHFKWSDDYDKDFGIVKWHSNGYFYVDAYWGKFPEIKANPIGDFFDSINKNFKKIEISISGNIHDDQNCRVQNCCNGDVFTKKTSI